MSDHSRDNTSPVCPATTHWCTWVEIEVEVEIEVKVDLKSRSRSRSPSMSTSVSESTSRSASRSRSKWWTSTHTSLLASTPTSTSKSRSNVVNVNIYVSIFVYVCVYAYLYGGRVLCKMWDLYVMQVCRLAIHRSRSEWYHRFVHMFKLSESVLCACRIHVIDVSNVELTRLLSQTSFPYVYRNFNV